jgi:prophage tail gpP-like protein
MIGIVVNGTPYTDFMSASVTVALETLANDFQFTASSVGDFPPLRQGDAVEVLVDDITVLTGFIDEVGGKDQEGDHVVTYTGRDKTGDLLDSQINVINDIRASDSLTLKRLIEIVIEHLGLSIKVVDNLRPAPFNAAEDIIQPKVEQNAFEFISVYARKRQALLSSTADGDILITQSSPVDSGAVLQRIQGGDDNNILAQEWTINASQLFNRYIYRGQLDPGALNFAGSSDVDTITDQGGGATDDSIRVGRQSVHVAKESYSSAQLEDRAKWGKQLATGKATRFSCTVKGHQMPQGGLWAVNTLAQVNSDVADITRKMLINTLTFSQGEGTPTTTRLEFVERNVYTINEKILAQRPAGDQNDAFGIVG